ncbi:unnamed protein product, partial [Darwinula stevensoni]
METVSVEDFDYSVLEEADLEEAKELVATDLLRRAPLFCYMDSVTPEDFRFLADVFVGGLVRDKVSLKAVHRPSGRMAGLRLAFRCGPCGSRFADAFKENFQRFHPQIQSVFSLADREQEACLGNLFERHRVKEYLSFYGLSVKEEFDGRRVAQTLMRLSLNYYRCVL